MHFFWIECHWPWCFPFSSLSRSDCSAFLHLGLIKLSSMQLCRLRKVSLLMLSLLACHWYKKNKLGPRTELWGTPDSTGILSDDSSPSITTDWLRSEGKVLIHSPVFPRMRSDLIYVEGGYGWPCRRLLKSSLLSSRFVYLRLCFAWCHQQIQLIGFHMIGLSGIHVSEIGL